MGLQQQQQQQQPARLFFFFFFGPGLTVYAFARYCSEIETSGQGSAGQTQGSEK